MKYLLPLLIISIFYLNSCKKNALKVDPKYEGEWFTQFTIMGDETSLSIDSEGNAEFHVNQPSEELFSGKAKIKNDILYIDSKKIIINQSPTLSSGQHCVNSMAGTNCHDYTATMILDDETFYLY